VHARRVTTADLQAVERRQGDLDGMHPGDGCGPRVGAGQVDDGLGRAQTVTSDRPARVLDPDDGSVERLERRSHEAAVE